MKGILNLLAKAKLVELSDDERVAERAPPAASAAAMVWSCSFCNSVAYTLLKPDSNLPKSDTAGLYSA